MTPLSCPSRRCGQGEHLRPIMYSAAARVEADSGTLRGVTPKLTPLTEETFQMVARLTSAVSRLGFGARCL